MNPKILHVGQPNLGDQKLFDELVRGIFERRWFTNNGQLVQDLESRLAEFLGVRYCMLVCNATVGLQLGCHALDLTGEVIVPAYTFVATPHSARWEGLDIVFAEPCPGTHLIDPTRIESLITERTSAIIGVHLWGQPCDIEAIDSIAKRHNLKVIYDAAHAFACQRNGTMVGNFGDLEVFSFHATKFFNTFEGGAVTTNDGNLAQKVRLMTNFGFADEDEVVHLGTNAKMTEICAAMGLACFEKLDDYLVTYRSNHQCYCDHLEKIPGIKILKYDEGSNHQYVVVEIDQQVTGVNRDGIADDLRTNDVLARKYFYPGCHRMEPYNTIYPKQRERLPVTDALCSKVLCLPTGTTVSEKDIRRVCDLIAESCQR